jgi:cytosine deaminase
MDFATARARKVFCMLVLTRQRNETIVIGNDIDVTVVDIRGDKVRLGIQAPRNVAVHRKEIYDQIQQANQQAAALQPADVAGLPSKPPPPGILNPAPAPVFPRAADSAGDPFLAAAMEEAQQGLREGGLPIGSVLVRGDRIIARGHNRRVQHGNPMAHAEIDCLTNAGRQATYRDTVLYSTLMPCFLCSGAVVQFGIPRVIVGESVNFAGAPDLLRGKGVEVIDLQDSACIRMMADFIRDNPKLWNEDIGK